MNDNQPTKKRYITFIGGACLAIVLGAIGSGVWELLLHPTARRGWMTVTELAARYWTQYEEKIIRIAANDPYAIFFSNFLAIFSAGVICILIGIWLKIIYTGLRLKSVQVSENVGDVTNRNPFPRENIIQKYFNRLSLKQLFFIIVSLGAVLSCVGFWVVLQIVAVGAATSIARDFNVSMQACEPFIGRDELIKLRSRFATMRKSTDFHTLAQDVNAISDKYKIPLPRHTPSEK